MESYSWCALLVNKYKMDTSGAETRRRNVRECETATVFFSLGWGEGGGAGWFSDSCHPAPPTRCLQHLLWNRKPPLPPMGRADCAHPCGQTQCAARASSASVLSVFRALITNPWETTAVLRLTQLAHKRLICFTNQQGKLQVQGCSIDSGVKSMELIPPPSPPTSCLHLWTSFSGTEYLSWIIK